MDFTFHNGTNGSSPWVEFYPYTPSNTAGYAFMAIFGIATVVHIVLMFPYHAVYFIPLILGGICETGGYYGRAWSHQSRTAIGSWALQEMLILCAPPFIAASIYMVLGRIIRAFNAEHHSSIRTKWLTTIFVLNDVICFLTQIAGAGVQVTGDADVMAVGKKVVLVGLVFALVVFGVFVWVAGAFHRRLDAEPTAVVRECPRLGWKKYMWAIYTSCGMLMLRNLVRTIQFASDKGSPLNSEEVYIYVFDAALMACSIGVLIVWHPGKLVRRAQKATKASQMCVQMEDAADIPLTGYREV
ncbi:hypothetical protein CNMCM5623_006379 [Aspergillus felis]|uniref:RTA1 domain protein n=1 Tax=Aspergillus felis TaxID=1287682 RepID=A0A8H6PTI7_9EURO|nr:hypothetical protein CNMCM5623_006379 [Aspergillus felis]